MTLRKNTAARDASFGVMPLAQFAEILPQWMDGARCRMLPRGVMMRGMVALQVTCQTEASTWYTTSLDLLKTTSVHT